MVFVRFLLIGFILMSIVYVTVWFYSRSVRREKLENAWAEEQPEGVTRDAYVAEGMTKYHSSLRPKLLLLIYVVPTIVVGTIVYIVNTN